MGIYDREYVRVGPRSSSGLGNVRAVSVNTWLIIINVAVFVLTAYMLPHNWPLPAGPAVPFPNVEKAVWDDPDNRVVVEKQLVNTTRGPGAVIAHRTTGTAIGAKLVYPQTALEYWGHFSTQKAFKQLEVWRFVTFQFLHATPDHLIFNMLGLWFVGGMVEQYLGRKRYLAFYLVCGIFGALMYLLLNLLGTQIIPALGAVLNKLTGWSINVHAIPGLLLEDPYTPLVGASAGIFGVLMAAAFIAPSAIVQVAFIIPMRLRTAVYGFAVIALVMLLTRSRNAGGEAAHIGGAIAGYYFIRHMHLLRDFFDVFGDSRGPRIPRRSAAPDAREVDRILAKISRQGIASLSEGERTTLRGASRAGGRRV